MKRLFTVISLMAMLLSLFACGAPIGTTADSTAPQGTDATPDTDASGNKTEAKIDEIGNGKHVVALLMDHERTAAYSGSYHTWSNSGKDLKHQPDKTTEDGLRDIASVYYPSIGLYDVTDPDYQEYMMQLCKMTYVDTLNYYISTLSEVKDGAWWGDNLEINVVPMLEKYGLNATARLEKPRNSMKSENDSATIIEGFTTILNKLGNRVLRIDGRPVIAQFSIVGLTAEMVEDWKLDYFSKYGTVPFFMATAYESYMSDDWNDTIDGYFGWAGLEDRTELGLQFSQNVGEYPLYVTLEQALNNHPLQIKRIEELVKQGKINFYSESVTPSFDDIAVWGWNTTPHKIEGGENNELYEFKWQSAVANNAQMVTIPTWDDWGEASTIEPTLQYGIDRLEITRKYAAEYKGIEANTASLELPGWIYKIRKTTSDANILADMERASNLIAESRYDEAEALVKPYVQALNIPATSKDFFDYPTTPTTPLAPVESDEGKTATLNGDKEIWNPTADTYVAVTSTKNVDSGKEEKMRVKNAYATNLSRYAFIQFDTSATSFEGVEKATLRLYCTHSTKNEEEIAGRDINLYATVADWQEETFSWKTKPLVTEKIADVDTTDLHIGQWLEIDVTEYLKYNFGKKISFSLQNDGADTEENHLDFATKEAGSNIPELVIVKGSAVAQKPTTEVKETSLVAVADTFVANAGAVDSGSDNLVRLKKMDTQKRTRNAYFKFDTTELASSDVFKATVKLYCHYTSTKPEHTGGRYIIMYATTADWNEGSFTWDTQPKKLEKIVAYVDTTAYQSNQWIEIDVTEYVKNHKGEVISIVLCDEGKDNDEGHVDFASREQQGKEPKLIVLAG